MSQISWEKSVEEQFKQVLEQIPALVRDIAEIRIIKKLENMLSEQNRTVISQKDMVDALFAETPPGFVPLMKSGLKELNIDFTKYGHA